MNIRKISVGNFKSLYSASFEPGKINVFVGANGSGKSTILEAIGLLSALTVLILQVFNGRVCV